MCAKPYNKTFQRSVVCGRLAKDPTIKILPKGGKVLNFGLIVTEENGSTNFVPCVAWDEKASRIADNVTKGALILCEGIIKSSSYKDSEDNQQYGFQYELKKEGLLNFLDNKKPDLSGLEELPELSDSND